MFSSVRSSYSLKGTKSLVSRGSKFLEMVWRCTRHLLNKYIVWYLQVIAGSLLSASCSFTSYPGLKLFPFLFSFCSLNVSSLVSLSFLVVKNAPYNHSPSAMDALCVVKPSPVCLVSECRSVFFSFKWTGVINIILTFQFH